jgi:hypothetical protein
MVAPRPLMTLARAILRTTLNFSCLGAPASSAARVTPGRVPRRLRRLRLSCLPHWPTTWPPLGCRRVFCRFAHGGAVSSCTAMNEPPAPPSEEAGFFGDTV